MAAVAHITALARSHSLVAAAPRGLSSGLISSSTSAAPLICRRTAAGAAATKRYRASRARAAADEGGMDQASTSAGNDHSLAAATSADLQGERQQHVEVEENDDGLEASETRLMSVAPLLPAFGSLAAAEGLRESLEPVGELIRSLNLPDWLVHWGHPGNMAVVLFAMGGYGTYLGWQIRLAGDNATLVKAKDMHPKLMAGMFFFFALGATGGITSLVTSGRPILDSPHAYTGLAGLALLTAQSALSANFKGNPEFRSIHAYLGTGIMALFLVHAALGLQLGLSF